MKKLFAFHFRVFTLAILILIASWSTSSVYCQVIEDARQMAYDQKFEEATSILKGYLTAYPNQMEAQLLLAHIYNWAGKHDLAVLMFELITKKYPQNTEGIIGLGYANAWSGRTSMAIDIFQRYLIHHPKHEEAQKGLAHAYLLAGRYQASANILNQLIKQHPGNSSYHIQLGRVYHQKNQYRSARASYHSALSVDPNNAEAKKLLSTSNNSSAVLEADVLGGYSSIGDEKGFGIRLAQIQGTFNKQLTLSARYDNSLSLDNFQMLSSGNSSPTIWAGGMVQVTHGFTTRLEYGWQSFQEEPNRNWIRTEQVFFTKNGISMKAGLQFDARKFSSRWATSIGLYLPFQNHKFALEPMYYISMDEKGMPLLHRFALGFKAHTGNAIEISAGGYYGYGGYVPENAIDQNIIGAYGFVIVPVYRQFSLQLIGYSERRYVRTIHNLAMGIKYRFSEMK